MSKISANKVIAAFGQMHVLAVGISNYPKNSGFSKLPVCSRDAAEVAAAIRDVPEIRATTKHIRLMASDVKDDELKPSKGNILRELRAFAIAPSADDQVIFYFSGHGVRLNQELYLVPQDVAAPDDIGTLLSFTDIEKELGKSEARVKIILLDACETGPQISFKSPLTGASDAFLAEYVKRTSGAVVFASCTADQTSTTKSPVSLSLFTNYLVSAFRGAPEALRSNRLLTLDSLYEYVSKNVIAKSREYGRLQSPSRRVADNGAVIVGDFSTFIQRVDLDLEKSVIGSISLQVQRSGTARDTLGATFKVTSTDRPSYVENRVNSKLSKDRHSELGELRAELCNTFGFTFSQVQVEEYGLSFPGGRFEFRYNSDKDDPHSGVYTESVRFGPEWFGQLDRMAALTDSLGVSANRMVLHLSSSIEPESLLAGLNSRGWKITSALDSQVKASQAGYSLTVRPDRLVYTGFSPQQLLAMGRDKADPKGQLVPGIVKLLGGGR